MADEETTSEETEVVQDAPAPEVDAEEAAPAQEATPAEQATPAQEAPAAPAGEAAAPVAPKQRRQRARAAKAARRPVRGQMTPEERQAEREGERRGKASARRSRRATERGRARTGDRAAPEPLSSLRPERTGQQKTRQGIVVSDRAAKTITVRIDVTRRHPRYDKVVRTSTTLHAHDEQSDAHIGDTVVIRESRPLSRTKRWRLIEVLERAK
jgi:small subunit ribosomal protein S17